MDRSMQEGSDEETFLTLKYGKVKYRIEFTESSQYMPYAQIMLDLIKIWEKHNIHWDETRCFWGYKNDAWYAALTEIKQYRADYMHTHLYAPFIISDPAKNAQY